MHRKSFTLIELLIVIAIIAVLAVVVILTLNPAQLLRQARDSNRISDLDTLNHAIALYQTDTASSIPGSTSTIYISLSDPSLAPGATSSCASLSLPTPPSGWSYYCVSSSNLRNSDGTGWIPINFKNISSGSPLPQLPLDPTNSASSYYVFTTSGSFYQITATAESAKYKTGSYNPGGQDGVLSSGNSTAISPLYSTSGLAGWWKFDEGTGSTAYDSSGSNATGTLTGGPSWTTGKILNALLFTNNSVNRTTLANIPTAQLTISLWTKPTMQQAYFQHLYGLGGIQSNTLYLAPNSYSVSWKFLNIGGAANEYPFGTLDTNWHHIVVTYDGSAVKGYVDGVLGSSHSASGLITYTNSSLYVGGTDTGNIYSGSIDDYRVYNRALSAAEVAAMYNATK